MITPIEGGAFTLLDGTDLASIYLNTGLQELSREHFQQTIAAHMAAALIGSTFSEDPASPQWWVPGLTAYLGGLVYPDANLEWKNLPALLADIELGTTLFDRGAANWIFFRREHPAVRQRQPHRDRGPTAVRRAPDPPDGDRGHERLRDLRAERGAGVVALGFARCAW
ncbi:MAG: hypothetical protein ACE5GB_09260 [Acidimicrobiales bacterium]